MSNPSYTCAFCDFKSTNKYIVNHYFNNHKEEMYKFNDLGCKVAARKGQLVHIPMYVEKEKQRMECCLGCKAFYANHTKALKHLENCKNKETHKKNAMALLPLVENTVEDNSEALTALKTEIAKLRKQVEKQREELKDYENQEDAVRVIQAVISDMNIRDQAMLYKKVIRKEEYQFKKLEGWNGVEWDDWFSSDVIDEYDIIQDKQEDEDDNDNEEQSLEHSDEESIA